MMTNLPILIVLLLLLLLLLLLQPPLTSSNHILAAASNGTNTLAAAATAAAATVATVATTATNTGDNGGNGGMGAENNPILYDEQNRTPAYGDIHSGVVYIFIVTLLLCFFLILPGIRNDKISTFLCITTSLIVTSIVLISLFGTTWHIAEAPISAAYKAFSKDRIQGELSVKIGLQSVNITLRAQKYYISHDTQGPILMYNSPKSSFSNIMLIKEENYTIKRVDVDINYNERFYWIEPQQMLREKQKALERGLPYPILTVIDYLSQDDAGFNWSRQYRLAGYYTHIILWLAFSIATLMFFLHCTAPEYAIYAMQILGITLLFANLIYAYLVPRGEQKLTIPFEGQPLNFKFGWSYWLVLIGGCLSLGVGTLIVSINYIFPNFIFTTVLDVDYDYKYHKPKRYSNQKNLTTSEIVGTPPPSPPPPHGYQLKSDIISNR